MSRKIEGFDQYHIVLYSGGLASFLTAYRVIAKFGKSDTVLVFTDTMTEDEDLYRFLSETVSYFDCTFVHLKDGRDVWQVFNDVRYMGNTRRDPCSRILKRELFSKWLNDNYQSDECVLYYGLDWTEMNRVEALKKRWIDYQVDFPLLWKPLGRKSEAIRILGDIDIEIPKLYKLGFAHNNCGGMCVKAGLAQFKVLYEEMPKRYLYHERKQEELFKVIGEKPFLRKTENGKQRYLSLKQYRIEYLEKGIHDEQMELDFGGCNCFA